jgi:hypothetical protein
VEHRVDDPFQPTEGGKQMPRHRVNLRALLIPAIGILFLNGLLISAAYASTFSLGPTGLGVVNGNLLVATRLVNTSGTSAGTAFDVEIGSITLTPAVRTSPTSFPISVGTIDADHDAVIQAGFSTVKLIRRHQYVLQVHGSYRPVSSDRSLSFTVSTTIIVPPGAPGEALRQTGTVHSLKVAGAKFPPIREPKDFNDANEAGPPVATGPRIPVTRTKTGTAVKSDPGDPSVTFKANDLLKLISGPFTGDAAANFCSGISGQSCVEPSGASNGAGIIFVTTNWTADYSTNGGGSFKQLNPTTIFPNDAVGYCCDQVVQFVPGIDRFVWVLQGTGYRLATASPATVKASGGTSWTYWNLTPGFFGLTGSLDYPDMSVGNNYLYLSFDEVGTGLMVARISLKEIAAGGTITVEWTNPSNGGPAYGGHVMQETGNEAFWAGHNTTSQMRIFSWAESSTTYFWRDVNIGSWSNTGLSATTPDRNDFLSFLSGFPDNSVIGAARAPGPPSTSNEKSSDGLWFAWSAGTDSNFKQPHVEMVTLDRSNDFKLVQQVQIWNSAYAYAYPALATNGCTREVGFSLEGGGSGNYENHLVGFWGDFVAYTTTNSNVGTTRYGDYVTIRQDPTPGLHGEFFDAFGYGLDKPAAGQTGTQADVRYVQFGRAGACKGG